jgi:DNA-directed RNA polymerase subunit RPC12/RpoP
LETKTYKCSNPKCGKEVPEEYAFRMNKEEEDTGKYSCPACYIAVLMMQIRVLQDTLKKHGYTHKSSLYLPKY